MYPIQYIIFSKDFHKQLGIALDKKLSFGHNLKEKRLTKKLA